MEVKLASVALQMQWERRTAPIAYLWAGGHGDEGNV